MLLGLFSACSTFTVSTTINHIDKLENAKSLGMIVRTSTRADIPRQDVLKNISHWMSGYKYMKQLVLLPNVDHTIAEYVTQEDRFLQRSASYKFLQYKSIGVVKSYLRTHRDQLLATMEENQCDGLIFYEVYTVISTEMQYVTYDSFLLLVDKNLEIVYLDYQEDAFDTTTFDFEIVKNQTMNRLSTRFIDKMIAFDFLEEL
jgi:hypothetical protein